MRSEGSGFEAFQASGRPGRAEIACVLLLALATLAGRLWVALAEPNAAMASDFLQDDAFYYMVIAGNVAEGRGFTFDGTVATNGFSPLYLLSLVPVLKLVGDDPERAIHAAGVLAAVLALGTGLLVQRLGRRVGGPWAGVLLLGLWALSPYFLAHSVNGMDTGSAAFFALALVYAYLRCAREGAVARRGRALVLGVVGGLALLARIDLGMLGVALALDWLVGALRARALRAELPAMAIATGAALVVWLSWGTFSYRATGSWTPQSGPAGREIALQYGWAHLEPMWRRDLEQPFFPNDDVPLAWSADVATRALSVFLFEHPLLAAFRLDQPFTFWPDARSSRLLRWFCADPPARAPLLAGLLLALVLACARWRRAQGADPRLGSIAVCFFLLILAGYTFLAPTHWFFPRYLLPLVLVTTVATVGGAARRLDRTRRSVGGRSAAAALVLLLLAGVALGFRPAPSQPYAALARADTPPGGFVLAWQRMRARIGPGQRIGAFQAGALAYFADRDVVNLDGKVNPDALRALQAGTIHEYLVERELDFVFDWNWIVHCLCLRHLPAGSTPLLRVVQEPTLPLEPSVFAVVRPPG